MDISLKLKSGIYKWVDTHSGKIYVGSAARCLYLRYHQHLSDLRLNKHGNAILQAIFNKRPDSLKFEVLEFCGKEVSLEREQFYIDTLNPEINILRVAGSRLGRKVSPETLVRMKSVVRTHEQIAKIKEARSKQVFTKEQLEYRASKVREANFRRVECSNGKVYNSVKEASLDLEIPEPSISRILTGYTKHSSTRHKLNFKYA